MQEKVLIYGAGGHAKVTVDLLHQFGRNFRLVGLLDDDPGLHGSAVCGFTVLGGSELLSESISRNCKILLGVAKPRVRAALLKVVDQSSLTLLTLVHPSASIASRAEIGRGAMVMAQAVVNQDALIGDGVVINTGAIVEHDCRIGVCVHIAPGAHLAGAVVVGTQALIGIGATIIERVTIGPRAIVGAGAVVIHNVPSGSTVVGNPARCLRRAD